MKLVEEEKQKQKKELLDGLKDKVNKREKLAQRNIPQSVPHCMDFNFDYKLISKNGLQFMLSTTFCDRGDFEKDSYALGQIGFESYYSELADWILEDLILDWCKDDFKKCIKDINVSIEGHTDSYPVRGPIDYGPNSFEILEGLNYSFRSPRTFNSNKTLSYNIKNKIFSNEELGLVRAIMAYEPFSKITSNPITIRSIEHTSPGPKFRKVVITINANNFFNKDFTKLRSNIMKSVEVKQKRVAKYLIPQS